MLLSIDTSAGTSAALFDGERLLSSVFFDDPFGHAENIAKAVTGVLSQANIAASALENITVGIGPAPYTGLRVGIAAAKALAGALGVGLHGVMVLDAIAFSRTEERLLVTTDAKRGELFAAGYVFGKREFGPRVIDPSTTAEFGDYEHVSEPADAEKVGRYALWALEKGIDLSETGAIYLRSPDVTPSPGKRVSG
ncbi:MAG: tRNA (adenosine(37)-N6)-threonylcarbamoyltransferase complex dimerization subunit type 1 TsaB [Aquiluna sp.]|nr:tRNA (adenosine(37)-N6)-threonylcarbamoyltransferase complex dimerization subunit type 1 TsaB [Actinomycetota bacterium]NCW29490.1 tRNA (adenosine(37)-N6)-threonylcarbamoyltransferase complex dimerization subunit type 1 TsaB [Actinomycetota bacterium]